MSLPGGGGGVVVSSFKVGMKSVAASVDIEEEKLTQPCFEGFLNGAWWEVDILERRCDMFRIRYSGLKDEEESWVSLDYLRLRARRCDDWDCGILHKNVDISVCCVHPQVGKTMALYDAKIVSVARSKHQLDCCCKFFVQFYCIKENTSSTRLKDRGVLKDVLSKEVSISDISMLQQPGETPLQEILRAHISGKWSFDQGRWSNDAYFLFETILKIVRKSKEELSMTTPRGEFQADLSEDVGVRPLGPMNRQGVSKVVKLPAMEPMSVSAGEKVHNREVKEVEYRGKNSSRIHNNTIYPDLGGKRNNDFGEEKETSNVVQEDYFPLAVSSRLTRSKNMTGHELRRQDQDIGDCDQAVHKIEIPLDLKRGRRLKIEDSESSPVEILSDHEDLLVKEDCCMERGSYRDVTLKRGRGKEAQKPMKAQKHYEHGKSRYDLQRSCEQVLKSKSNDTGKYGKFPDKTVGQLRAKDYDHGTFFTPKAEKGSLAGREPKLDKSEDENLGKKRGRPKGRTNSRNSVGTKDVMSRPKCSQLIDYEFNNGGSLTVNFESFKHVTAPGVSRKIETGCELSRKESKGGLEKPPEKITSKRSSDRRKVSSLKPIRKRRGLEKVDTDAGLKKTDGYLSTSAPNSEDPPSEPGSQLRKLRPRIPLKLKKSLSKGQSDISSKTKKIVSNQLPRDAKKKKGITERVMDRPLYMDLLVNNSKDDDVVEKLSPAKVPKPQCGLDETWDPIVEDVLSDSDYDIVSEKDPEVQKVWQEFDLVATAVCKEGTSPLAVQDNAQLEVHECDCDLIETKCDHSYFLKDDVGMVCCNCGLVSVPIEDVVPHVEISQRHSREAGLDEWDFDRNSADGNQGVIGYEEVKNGEMVTMLNASLPPHYAQQMHPHQKEGFEFLWRNLGYDAQGNLRNKKADKNAGCILSHAPGTGKSFLIISFLKSYMDKFPNSQPLIVAPKIMLLRWEKEFTRWKSDIKVFILNTATLNGKRLIQKHEESGVISLKSHQLTSRVAVDMCRMAMLYEWKSKRSVCLVSYTMFSSLTDEEKSSKSQEGEAVRRSLLESTGILILDEGHFPRNKDTRIRKSLMKVKTNARILLSGTLFQNNFEELFNTLYLVRPGFVEAFASCDLGFSSDMLGSALEGNLVNGHLAMEEITEAAEKRARKLFVDEVGMKIEEGQLCKGSEVLQDGLQRLQRLTAEFVHHHTGEVLASLPGLRDFGILLKPTTLQCSLVEILEQKFQRPEECLKREIAVSETSIHPKLLTKLDFVKGDMLNVPQCDLSAVSPSNPEDGVKTKFVFDLLHFLKFTSEKVLIFSQHITPLEMLEDMFKGTFNWEKNKDVLRLDGTMAMNDREAVIERFNDPQSQVQVLLASTKACGEGITLIGASRVIFMDVLWNPAVIKQAISRAFRLGQKKIVYVYRLVAIGTIEEKKYKKAIRKDWLSMSIFAPTQEETNEQTDISLDTPEISCLKPQSLGEEILAWEVDASTCEDDLLKKLLNSDKSRANSFVKVVEHGSQFHNRKIACGPDAREWFLEDWDYKDLSLTKDRKEGEVLGSKLYQDYGDDGAFDTGAASSSDTDEDFL